MKATKVMLTGFAIFAAALMLLTPCMARPVTEKTNIDAVEAQQELMNSFKAFDIKLSTNVEASALLKYIEKDQSIASIVSNIQTEEDILIGVEQLAIFLQDSSEAMQLVNLIQQECCSEVETISEQIEVLVGGDNHNTFEDPQQNTIIIILLYIIALIILAIYQIVEPIISAWIEAWRWIIGIYQFLWDLITDMFHGMG